MKCATLPPARRQRSTPTEAGKVPAVAQLTHLSALCADSFHRKAYANFSAMDIPVAPPSRASEVEAA
jgi:hypothetical protein